MARKNPTKQVLKALERHNNMMEHCSSILRNFEKNPDRLWDYIKEKTPMYYIGLADGANTALENILHDQNCYNGYCYRAEQMDYKTGKGMYLALDHPEFKEWRRYYFHR
jgi:hypothetical protein